MQEVGEGEREGKVDEQGGERGKGDSERVGRREEGREGDNIWREGRREKG